jgi:SnoaL-like domain
MDADKNVARWGRVVDRFNEGDLEPMAAMLAEDCVFHSSLGPVGTTRDEIIASIRQAREAGWTGHFPISLSAAGDFLTGVFRNDYADGSSVVAAGILRFRDDGQIVEMRSMEPAEYVAKMSG